MDIATAHVLVTGGSSGIGLETARQLRERGARIAICGRDAARVKEAAAAIEQLGGYDTLINNAGFGHFAPLRETSLADMQRVYATNVFGAMLAARETARHFVAQQRGNIVNVASTAGQRGFAGGTAYASSKFALSGLTECWLAELRKFHVRVMQINPTKVQIGFVTASGRPAGAYSERKLQPADIAHAIVGMLAMEDRGFVPEVAVWATNPD